MYEHKSQDIITTTSFLKRIASHFVISVGLLGASLGFGILGYAFFEKLPLIDGFLNAAMLLGGMGPVNPPVTAGGKMFAGFFALYAGLIFIVLAALMFTPVLHRLLHKFHWTEERED